MKTSYWAAYRDITDFPRGEIELMKAPQPGVKRVKPGYWTRRRGASGGEPE